MPGDQLPARLRALWRRWSLTSSDVGALVVAARGVWTGAERRRLARRLRPLARQVSVMSDVEAAHVGALGDRPGVLLLAGTGSIALGRDAGGRWSRAGGLGPLLGDEGSAFWIGREWLRRGARGRRGPASSRAGDGLIHARRLARRPDAVARIAALAPAVLRAAREGSGPARHIVAEAAEHLAALVVTVYRDLRRARRARRPERPRAGAPPERVPVSWAGGLLGDPALRRAVWGRVRTHGLLIAPTAPERSALDGAAALAEEASRARRASSAPPRSSRRRAR